MNAGIIVIAGPTAGGKSALALELAGRLAADRLGAVLINADSMQVYRELRVLSARPDAAAERRVPHRLYGILPASEPCSAARWRALALAEIAVARDAGRLAIVVGGTGLYLHALLCGLAPVPEVPWAVRARARALYRELGADAFRARLAALDPDAAGRLAAGDRLRLIRAWEVAEATGVTLAAWQARAPAPLGLPALKVLVMPAREALYRACDARFEAMVAAGALAEVRALVAAGLDAELPAMKALGVPALARHLAGESTLEQAVEAAQRATRNYAKRQLTWFRHRFAADLTLAPGPEAGLRLYRAVGRFAAGAALGSPVDPAPRRD